MNKSTRILIVDDEPLIIEAYTIILRDEGYEVWEASTGGEGLQLARERRPDLVLLDVMLPDISGLKVCKQIKSDPELVDVFVVLFSGRAMTPANKVDGLAGGADDYLAKPVNIDEFRARIRTIVRLRNTTAALRASERHYRQLVEILPEAVCMIDPQARLLTVNPRAASMLGFENPEELLATPPLDFIAPAEVTRMRVEMAAALKAGILQGVNCTMVRKDGSHFPAELSGAVLKETNGRPLKVVVVVRDCTERNRAAEVLRASEERFRQLAENINDVFWIIDPAKSKMIYASRGYERTWGRSCQSLLDSAPDWFETIHPEDRDRVREAARVKRTAGKYDEEYRILRPDGSERWIQDRAFPVRDGSGHTYRVVGIAEDITKRKQAEEALREAEAKYRTIVENATDGMFRSTPEGRYLNANPAFARMLGYKSPEELTANITDIARQVFVEPEVRSDLKKRMEALPVVDGFEVECFRKDTRKIWVSVNGRAVRDARGAVLYYECTCQDITARKKAEQEMRQLPWRIIEAQEAERSRVALELHDGVNQTIASAKMRLRKVQATVAALGPATREILSRCERLLVQALEENRRIAHNLHPSVLDELGLAAGCRALCRELHARTNLKVQSNITLHEERLSPAIEINLFRIVQEAFNNIEKHARAKTVQLRLSDLGDAVVLKIKDDGRGFDPSRVKNLKGKRSGIGLTSLRERAAILGGTSKFESTAKNGTVITVRVPRVDPK